VHAPDLALVQVGLARVQPDDPDVAEAAVYLASDRAAFINGVVLLLDGGMRAGYNTGARGPKNQG